MIIETVWSCLLNSVNKSVMLHHFSWMHFSWNSCDYVICHMTIYYLFFCDLLSEKYSVCTMCESVCVVVCIYIYVWVCVWVCMCKCVLVHTRTCARKVHWSATLYLLVIFKHSWERYSNGSKQRALALVWEQKLY